MLTESQKILYNYLVQCGDTWKKQVDVVRDLFYIYPYFTAYENFHDSRARVMLTDDIRAINDSDEVPKVIISNKNGIKLATEEEWRRSIRAEYSAVFRRLKRIRHKEKKGRMNGQARLVFESEQDIIEAFLREA